MTDIQRIIDERDIRNVMLRYARGIDRRDWEMVRSVLHEDSQSHHGDFKGSRDEFVSWIAERHVAIPRSTHLLGNCTIEFGSDAVAAVESYFMAVMELNAEAEEHSRMLLGDSDLNAIAGTIRIDILGRYVDRFEKRDGEWRVASRKTVFDSTHSRPNVGSFDDKLDWALGRRDQADPIFEVRRQAGLG